MLTLCDRRLVFVLLGLHSADELCSRNHLISFDLIERFHSKGRFFRLACLAQKLTHVFPKVPAGFHIKVSNGVANNNPARIGMRLTGFIVSPGESGGAALRAGVELHELREERTDLEDVFLALTADPAPVATS